jgi:hypothetical protein
MRGWVDHSGRHESMSLYVHRRLAGNILYDASEHGDRWWRCAVEKLYASGMRDRQIAEALGIPLKDARYIRKKLGLASHDSRTSNRYPDLPAQVRALHARSWSDGDIARLSGAHRSTVSRIRRGLGLPAHMRWGLSREQYRRWLDERR